MPSLYYQMIEIYVFFPPHFTVHVRKDVRMLEDVKIGPPKREVRPTFSTPRVQYSTPEDPINRRPPSFAIQSPCGLSLNNTAQSRPCQQLETSSRPIVRWHRIGFTTNHSPLKASSCRWLSAAPKTKPPRSPTRLPHFPSSVVQVY